MRKINHGFDKSVCLQLFYGKSVHDLEARMYIILGFTLIVTKHIPASK